MPAWKCQIKSWICCLWTYAKSSIYKGFACLEVGWVLKLSWWSSEKVTTVVSKIGGLALPTPSPNSSCCSRRYPRVLFDALGDDWLCLAAQMEEIQFASIIIERAFYHEPDYIGFHQGSDRAFVPQASIGGSPLDSMGPWEGKLKTFINNKDRRLAELCILSAGGRHVGCHWQLGSDSTWSYVSSERGFQRKWSGRHMTRAWWEIKCRSWPIELVSNVIKTLVIERICWGLIGWRKWSCLYDRLDENTIGMHGSFVCMAVWYIDKCRKDWAIYRD